LIKILQVRNIDSFVESRRQKTSEKDRKTVQSILNDVRKNGDSAVKNQVFCPLGNGVIDFKKIINQLNNINYNGYATIEQDIDPNEGLDSINYAMKSLSYLEKLGCKKL